MGYLRFNYRSQALGRYVDITITYPTDTYSYYDITKEKKGSHDDLAKFAKPIYEPGMKFQTVYLIHGGGDDDTLPFRYTSIERYAQENNVMVVAPNITNSLGVDTEYGVNYQTFLAEELPVLVQALFASSPKREDNFIVGFAMGGNVALGTAIMHPEKYAMCVDISGGIGLTLDNEVLKDELNGDHFKTIFPIYNSTFGKAEDLEGSKHNIYKIAKEKKENGDCLSKFILICGSEEFIRYRVEKDVAKLQELDYPVEYIVAEGYNHDYVMWDKYLEVTLNELLPLERKYSRKK